MLSIPFPLIGNPIDLLVNNAGLGLGLESADKASLDDWMQMIDTKILKGSSPSLVLCYHKW